jgi:hypothetical protein
LVQRTGQGDRRTRRQRLEEGHVWASGSKAGPEGQGAPRGSFARRHSLPLPASKKTILCGVSLPATLRLWKEEAPTASSLTPPALAASERESVLSANQAKPGDTILVSGTLADHGIAILAEREGLLFETQVVTGDLAALHMLVDALLEGTRKVRWWRIVQRTERCELRLAPRASSMLAGDQLPRICQGTLCTK